MALNNRLFLLQKVYTGLSGHILLFFALFGIFHFFYTVNFHGQLIFGIFQVNKIQTLFHLITGLAGMVIFYDKKKMLIQTYVRFSGIFYGILAIWGIPAFSSVYDKVLFGLIHVNAPTENIHILIGVFGLLIGYVCDPNYKSDEDTQSPLYPEN